MILLIFYHLIIVSPFALVIIQNMFQFYLNIQYRKGLNWNMLLVSMVTERTAQHSNRELLATHANGGLDIKG